MNRSRPALLQLCLALMSLSAVFGLVLGLSLTVASVQAASFEFTPPAKKTAAPAAPATANPTAPKAANKKNRNKKALHGQSWAFGQGSEHGAALWNEGVASQKLRERAVPKVAHKKTVDTTPGIDNALDAAQRSKKARGSLGMSMDSSTSHWREMPADMARSDEDVPLERRRVLRAFADVAPGDDLSISVGPELILKDEQSRETSKKTGNQPDSALGMGMQFKLDF